MSAFNLERVIAASKSLEPPNTLGFCTRCGSVVEPYFANEVALRNEYGYDDYLQPPTPPEMAKLGYRTYQCSQCAVEWVACSTQGTGHVGDCDHFIPYFLIEFCGVCGKKVK